MNKTQTQKPSGATASKAEKLLDTFLDGLDAACDGRGFGAEHLAAKTEIVRAVNCHDELVAALRDVMRCYVGDRNSKNMMGESGVVADIARAALDRAEKGGE